MSINLSKDLSATTCVQHDHTYTIAATSGIQTTLKFELEDLTIEFGCLRFWVLWGNYYVPRLDFRTVLVEAFLLALSQSDLASHIWCQS